MPKETKRHKSMTCYKIACSNVYFSQQAKCLKPYVADFGFLIAVPLQHGLSCVMLSVGTRILTANVRSVMIETKCTG